MKRYKTATIALVALLFLVFVAHASFASSQWSRKFEQPCTYCHTSFPRLNYNGELFMRNGYQLPDTQDGDEAGKVELNDQAVIGKLGDYFGARINLTALKVKQEGITIDGEKETSFDIGSPTWLQFFVAGSIFKNCSIFIETEITTEEDEIHSSWFRVGFHNLGGSSLANVRIGHMAPLEWTSSAGRLRIIPSVKTHAVQKVKSSNGFGEDSVAVTAAYPALSFYGWNEKFIYEFGVQNGADLTDPNRDKNFWGNFRYDLPSGSNFSFHAQRGTDTADTAVAQVKNDFYRVVPGLNFRRGHLDILFTYVYGHEDNWNLAADPEAEMELTWHGISTAGGAFLNPKSFLVLQWDWVKSDDDKTIEHNVLTPSFWYHPRENIKIGFTPQFDLRGEDEVFHPKKLHNFTVTLRSMF